MKKRVEQECVRQRDAYPVDRWELLVYRSRRYPEDCSACIANIFVSLERKGFAQRREIDEQRLPARRISNRIANALLNHRFVRLVFLRVNLVMITAWADADRKVYFVKMGELFVT